MRVEIEGLKKMYGGHLVLDIPEFLAEFPHCLALVGPSGGGKSTLLRILGGLESPDAGVVRIDGEELPQTETGLQLYRRSVGTVFQSFNLFPHLDTLSNVTLPLVQVHGIPMDRAKEMAVDFLRRFGMEEHASKRPAELSGGQRQRVAIARAVAIRPKFLLLDEPTSALDPEMTAEVLELLDELRQEERPLVLVTHELGFARNAADQIAFLAGGGLEAIAPSKEFFEAPPTPEIRRFLAKTLRFA